MKISGFDKIVSQAIPAKNCTKHNKQCNDHNDHAFRHESFTLFIVIIMSDYYGI